jgi:hypothetical protein
MANHTILRITPYAQMANQLGQLMFCLDVQRHCRQPILIEGYNISEWSLAEPVSEAPASDISLGSHHTKLWPVCRMIDWLKPSVVHVYAPIWRQRNFSDPRFYQTVLPAPQAQPPVDENTLLIHIRAGDVAAPSHPSYGPLPISYYKYLAARTGLKLAFIGQLEKTPYVTALKEAFPDATYLCGGTPMDDFQAIRSAAHIAIGVSSFSWIAAFLSTSAKSVHLPLAGLFDPRERPDVDALPLSDSRFVLHAIPKRSWRQRYQDYLADDASFKVVSRYRIIALKTLSTLRTAPTSARIHLGLLRRMI